MNGFDAKQISQLRARVDPLLPGEKACLVAVPTAVQHQKSAALVQTGVQSLCRLDKPHLRCIGIAVEADAAVWFLWPGQQPFALVGADRFDVHSGGLGEEANAQSL